MHALLGFTRHYDGCEFDVPPTRTVALWRWFAERSREAGFQANGQRCAELARRLTMEQSEL
jgi:hypothetical protein